MALVTLDWSSAEVRGGDLEVALQGDLPKPWHEAFDRTVALLHGGEWGKVKLKKDRVRVQEVTEGCEDRLRHFLESALQQANASAGLREDEAQDEAGDEDDEPDSLDAAMTEKFRSFAGETDT